MNRNDKIEKDYEETKGKGSSGKNRRKSNRRTGEKFGDRSKRSMNDITWYAANPQLLVDSASLPRAWATGLEHDLTHDYSGEFSKGTTPGFLAIETVLDPITMGDDSDPINVVARKITGFIRSFNSGAKNYDANDLMIRLIAEASFIAQLNWAQRIYATVNMYSAMNRYMPEAIIQAQNVDFNDIRLHLNDFRSALNNIIANASSVMFVPNGFYIYKRWAWLFANYYADTNSVKDQLYFLFPKGYYQFEIHEETSMGRLVYKDWAELGDYSDPLTYDMIIDGLRQQLEAIINDQDFAIMRGDMMKAYGASDYSFGLLPENFVALPVHDPIVLSQFKNLRTSFCIHSDEFLRAYDIVQDDSATYLTYGSEFFMPHNWYVGIGDGGNRYYAETLAGDVSVGESILDLLGSDHPADTYNPTPTAVDNMEDSRLTAMVTSSEVLPGGVTSIFEMTHGSEFVTSLIVGRRINVRGQWMCKLEPLHTCNLVIDRNGASGDINASASAPANIGEYITWTSDFSSLMSDISAFDYMPPLYFLFGQLKVDGEDNRSIDWSYLGGNWTWPIMRVCNRAFFTREMVKKMNDCAMKSEFNIVGFSSPKDNKITSK